MGVSIGLMIAVGLLTGIAFADGTEGQPAHRERPPLAIPLSGTGNLATIVSSGTKSLERALEIHTARGARRLPVAEPVRVRWHTPADLIVAQSVFRADGTRYSRIIRIGVDGELRAVLSDDGGLAFPEPSPAGRLVAVTRLGRTGPEGREIRDLEDGFRVRVKYPHAFGDLTDVFSSVAVWSPRGDQLAIGIGVREPHSITPRLALLAMEAPFLKRLAEGRQGSEPEPGGVMPLFWNRSGIYGRSGRGLIRCDPEGSGCSLVYALGEDRFAFAGTSVGEEKALLLVQDHRRDPFESRAKEIHEVDLLSGKGRILVDLPDDVFVEDAHWIADAAPRAGRTPAGAAPESGKGP